MAKRRLSPRQIDRIKNIQQQRRQRAQDKAEEVLKSSSLGPEQTGRVITNYGKSLIVEDHDGNLHRCIPRQNLGNIVCGDEIVWQAPQQNQDAENRESGVVTAVNERASLLGRPDPSGTGKLKPIAANLDQVIIVAAPAPELSEEMIDRYLVATEHLDLKPLILINKIDLLDEADLKAIKKRVKTFTDIGYSILYASAKTEHGMDQLYATLTDKISIFVGQSGVGKSSLINALLPNLAIRTKNISERSGLGQHTTTSATLYHLPEAKNGSLIDSPGVRAFDLWDISNTEVAYGFIEFREYLGMCRFSDCKHRSEPGCAVNQALNDGKIAQRRMNSYHRMVENLELNRGRLRNDPLSP